MESGLFLFRWNYVDLDEVGWTLPWLNTHKSIMAIQLLFSIKKASYPVYFPGKRLISIISYSQLVQPQLLHYGGHLDQVDVGQDRPVSCCRQLQVQLRLASDR